MLENILKFINCLSRLKQYLRKGKAEAQKVCVSLKQQSTTSLD